MDNPFYCKFFTGFFFQYCCFIGNVQQKMKFKDKDRLGFTTLNSVVNFFKLLGPVVSFWPAFYSSGLIAWRVIFELPVLSGEKFSL